MPFGEDGRGLADAPAPDAVFLFLGEGPIPTAAWAVPAPRIGIVRDAEAAWHEVGRAAPHCDLLLSAVAFPGARVGAGVGAFAVAPPKVVTAEKDIDVVAVGFGGPVLSRAAAAAVRELSALPHRVRFSDRPDDLGRATVAIVAGTGLAARRAALAAAGAGALVLFEANPGGLFPFRDGVEAIGYSPETIAPNLRVGLTNAAERERVVAAARKLAAEWDAAARSRDAIRAVDDEWAALTARSRGRPAGGPEAAAPTDFTPDALRRAADALPGKVSPLLNLSVAEAGRGRRAEAIDAARRGVVLAEALTELSPADRDPAWAPAVGPEFRTRWDRAWLDPKADKLALVRGRLHALLADLTDDLAHHYEAYLACPASAAARASLGGALLRAGRPVEALPHLRAATAADPFARPAARACYEALGAAEAVGEQRAFARRRRRLAEAAPDRLPAEPWFAAAPPLEDDLASVVVLCHDQLPFTRLCLESVLRHTRRPFELVVVDNGSAADTGRYLDDVKARPEPHRVVVVRNGSNRGYPAGCNQGLAATRGGTVVLLNNDVVVTAGWLDGLLAHFAGPGGERLGMVGPVSNFVADPQRVPVDYEDAGGLARFAEARRRAFAGSAVPADRLSGFCLAVRRRLIDAVGGLDERYGLGLFDDDDWCLRARDAGFRLAVAPDVFVHHFGGRTFRGLGLDVRECLRANYDVFRDKWGDERLKDYRPAEPAGDRPALGPGPAAPPRPNVSLTMIVRNEAHNIGECLATVADLVDEVVVVDTGSADDTKEIARRHGARVYDFPWVDNFAAARNEALRHATGRWVLWLDADDRLAEEDRAKLRAVFARLGAENAAYVMKVRSATNKAGTTTRLLDQVRLFRNHPYIRWRYRIHEQILPAVGQAGGKTRWTDVVVTHTGYQDPALRRTKLERNTRLLEIEYAEQPDDAFTLFNLGRSYLDLDRTAEALPILQKSLDRSDPTLSIVRKLYPLITQAHWHLGDRAQAQAVCQRGLDRYPEDAELLYQAALLAREGRDFPRAANALHRLLQSRPGEYFDMVEVGLRGFKARHLLGAVYRDMGKDAEAEAEFRAALAEKPDYPAAAVSLCDLLLARRAFDAAEAEVGRLAADPAAAVDAAMLTGRIRFGQKRYAEARAGLEAAVAAHPRFLPLRVLLTHVLIEEAADWPAAEAALRAVLDQDPDHKEARHNLDVLLRKKAGGVTGP